MRVAMQSKTLAAAALALLLFSPAASAHNPRLVSGNETVVENPEVSQAFYGEFDGGPHYFLISSDKRFNLYLQALVPDVQGAGKDVSFELYRGKESAGSFMFKRDASAADWLGFHEEFADDDYFQGPDAEKNAAAGEYLVKVYRPGNAGKYVFVVGREESFPPQEIINAVFVLPAVKTRVFGKPWWSAYSTKAGGLALGVLIAALASLAALAYWLWRKKRKKASRHNSRSGLGREENDCCDYRDEGDAGHHFRREDGKKRGKEGVDSPEKQQQVRHKSEVDVGHIRFNVCLWPFS